MGSNDGTFRPKNVVFSNAMKQREPHVCVLLCSTHVYRSRTGERGEEV